MDGDPNKPATLNGLTYLQPQERQLGGSNGAMQYWSAHYLQQESNDYLEWQIPADLVNDLGGVYSAIGFDLGQFYGSVEQLTIGFDGANPTTVYSGDNSFAFVGFVSASPFSSVELIAPNFPVMDNIAVGNLGSVVPVPEPGAHAWAGTVLLFVAATWRRISSRKRN